MKDYLSIRLAHQSVSEPELQPLSSCEKGRYGGVICSLLVSINFVLRGHSFPERRGWKGSFALYLESAA